MTADPVISAASVKKSFEQGALRTPVLRGVDLEVRRGEVVAIVGPSGSGKTTLLNLFGALDSADSGALTVAGEPLIPFSPRRAELLRRTRLGFVFQFYNLLPTLSACENVELAGDASGLRGPSRRTRALELLDLLGLAHRKDALPGELSGGEQQRVALARAAYRRPELLLADEPTGNLDAANGRQVLDLLLSLRERDGSTVVIVTHDPAVAARASRVVHMLDGRVDRTG